MSEVFTLVLRQIPDPGMRSDLGKRLIQKEMGIRKLAVPMIPEVCSLCLKVVRFLTAVGFSEKVSQGSPGA